MERGLAEGGVIWRALAAWADLRGSMRAELDRHPSEGRLLFYVMLSGLVWFFGRFMGLAYGPAAPLMDEAEFLGRVSAELGAALFARTLALYGVAVLLHAVARAAGGTGGWRDSRAALFWAALVAAPAMLAAQLLSLLAADLPGQAATTSAVLGSVVFAWVAGQCVAEAHGFPGIWRGFAVVVAMALLIAGLVYAISWL